MNKGLHKVFKAILIDISQHLPSLDEFVSKYFCFIPEPRYYVEVTRLSEDIKKPWLKVTLKEIKCFINDKSFLVQET